MTDVKDMTTQELINKIRECHKSNATSWFHHYLNELESRLKKINIIGWK